MNGRDRKKFVAIVVGLLAIGLLFICLRHSTEPVYDGKPLRFWCDHLPGTFQFPGADFVRGFYGSTNQQEAKELRHTQEQALLAINALGTDCLPELLTRLRKKPPTSKIEIQSRWLAIRTGLMKPWRDPREMALTGIVELGHRARLIDPELTALTTNTDPWLRAAASYALDIVNRQEIDPRSWEEKLRIEVSNALRPSVSEPIQKTVDPQQ
jgi:hypothetical protein